MVRSKEQEIEILKKWSAEAHEESGSYLAAFMRPELVTWVKSEIQSDGCPDVWAEMVQMENKERDTSTELLQVRAAEKHFREALEQARQEISGLEDVADDRAHRIVLLEVSVRDHDAEAENLRTQLMIAQAEVNRLKARLWDMHEAHDG